MKVLYAGDSPVGGAANYLLGVLRFMRASVVHIPPANSISAKVMKRKFDVIIFSDYSKARVSQKVQRWVTRQVERGSGFLMVGGWGSFSGPFGGWRGSLIEKILPVSCFSHDDRKNFPGGAVVQLRDPQSFLSSKMFKKSPVICGLNQLIPRSGARVLLKARPVISDGHQVRFDSKTYPLLVLKKNGMGRTAALATDLAPHWCGGLVDWGTGVRKLSVTPKIQIQVGNYYMEFISALLGWLVRV